MMSESPMTLRTARESTIEALCERFADETLSMGELERRLEKARSARSRAELDALLSDLQPKAVALPADAPSPAPAKRRTARPARSEEPAPRHLAFAIMAGTRRRGHWKPPASVAAVAIMGGVELDFRDAELEPGVTDINCFAFWGGVEITVPPDVNVESNGFAIMGGFDQSAERKTRAADDAPTLRVNGFALMGGVDIKVKERTPEQGSGPTTGRSLGRGRG
jgi:hypothetical protein